MKGNPVNRSLYFALAILFGLTACSSERVSYFPSYKLKVVQGNELNAKAVTALQKGMTKDQIQLLLGTPLLHDPFHTDRWDYIFYTARNGVINDSQRTLTLYFQNNQLIRAEGNAMDYAIQQIKANQNTAIKTN